jgi:hypothetical protein
MRAFDQHSSPLILLKLVCRLWACSLPMRVSPRRLAEFHPLASLSGPFPMEALSRLAAEAG